MFGAIMPDKVWNKFLRPHTAIDALEVPLPQGVVAENVTGVQLAVETGCRPVVFFRVVVAGSGMQAVEMVYKSGITPAGWEVPQLVPQQQLVAKGRPSGN